MGRRLKFSAARATMARRRAAAGGSRHVGCPLEEIPPRDPAFLQQCLEVLRGAGYSFSKRSMWTLH